MGRLFKSKIKLIGMPTNAEKIVTHLKTCKYDVCFEEDWDNDPSAITVRLDDYTYIEKDQRLYPTLRFALPIRNNSEAARDIKTFCKCVEDTAFVPNVKVDSIWISHSKIFKEEAPQGEELSVANIYVIFEEA